MEDQILEIDSVLNGVDITETVGKGEAEKSKVVHVESPSCDVSKKLPVSVENG